MPPPPQLCLYFLTMLEVREIDECLCAEILSDFSDNPLFALMERGDTRKLLMSSVYVAECDGELCRVEAFTDESIRLLFPSYYASTSTSDIQVPVLLLKGAFHYTLPSDSLITSPEATVEAPLLALYGPHRPISYTIYPNIFASPNGCAVLLDPICFEQMARQYPALYRLIIESKERLFSEVFKWLSLNTIASTEYRIARWLLAHIPPKHKKKEAVQTTQQLIADKLKISRASLAKGISSLQDKHVIETGHGKIIVNTTKLKEYLARGAQLGNGST